MEKVERKKAVTAATIGDHVKQAEYSVRGFITQVLADVKARMKKGEKMPFEKFTICNIGNPLDLGQPCLTFPREVLAVAMCPWLLTSQSISADAKDRAKFYMSQVEHPQALGAYSPSAGFPFVIESVCKFIAERDGFPADPRTIFLTNGAGEACNSLFKVLLSVPQIGVMVPIPQYPMYSAETSINHGTLVPYYLDESKHWGLDLDEVNAQYKKAMESGLRVKMFVIINPSNPTGHVMSKEDLVAVVKFCSEHNLVLMSDEVYQENVYSYKPFFSAKKIINEMGPPYNQLELASLHSVSKGLTGECGLRGGYMELVNFDPGVLQEVHKVRAMLRCPNTIGQMMVEMMVNPPKPGVNSPEVVERHQKELKTIYEGMKTRAKHLTQKLNTMSHIKCNEIEGAMYAFPSVLITESAIAAAKERNISPGQFFCSEVLKNIGLVIVPGRGFKQRENTYHFRITILIYNTEEFDAALEKLKAFTQKFFETYP